ncbi:hypothetical protein FRC01_012743 [Tulasnella sp. 417]|nr:hypothetical protein FRC01_012743 [Tulasnella sp. 417]
MASRLAPYNISPFGINAFDNTAQALPPLRFQRGMLISFTISMDVLRQDFGQWPEVIAQFERMKFKRYHAYVYNSAVDNSRGIWNYPNRPPGAPAERVQIAMIGPDHPSPAYFNKAADSLHPDEKSNMCHLLDFSPRMEPPDMTEQDQSREPLRVRGPQSNRCKFSSAYIYTSKKLEIRGTCPHPSSRGSEQLWILDEDEHSRLEASFMEGQGRIDTLQEQYNEQHPKEPPVGFTLEDGRLLLDGIDIDISLANYIVPVEAFLDFDDQDKVEDPCDFQEEVSTIRRALYEHYKKLVRDSTSGRRNEISTWAGSVVYSDWSSEYISDAYDFPQADRPRDSKQLPAEEAPQNHYQYG